MYIKKINKIAVVLLSVVLTVIFLGNFVSNCSAIEYKGEKMSFNQFGCELTGWKAIQIYAFMKKVGGTKTLSKLREEKMEKLGMLD